MKRGFDAAEAAQAAKLATAATRHGIRTHNAIKALHLDDLFGSKAGGCAPGRRSDGCRRRFEACRDLGRQTRSSARRSPGRRSSACIELADQYGTGTVSVDNAFHYLWGGGYVMEAAKRGYIAYTNCTASLAEVVPFGGKFPTLGTNPHSWGFPTTDAVGFPVVIDWATTVIAMGRVQQFSREGKPLPPDAAVDARRQAHDRPARGHVAAALRRPQGLRPVADQRNRGGLDRRLAAHHPQPGRRGRREAELHASFSR